MTGLALYDYLREYTGDDEPWIQNPIGFFHDKKLNIIVMANQKTGAVTLLYK